jgi:hypothetical protein
VPEPESPQRGKTRTWWHPLLVNVLRWQLADYYRVEEEVNIGQKPLQIDVLLLRQQSSDLPESVRQMLAGFAEYLNEWTLVEFKSPSDTLRAGDFQTFLAYALLYREQNDPLLDPSRLNLLVLAPKLTETYRAELEICAVTVEESEQAGIRRLRGGMLGRHAAWVVETDVLADLSHPMLTVFSPRLLREGVAISQQLRHEGYEQLLAYVTQQIAQFHLQGELFAMQHIGTDTEMAKVWAEILSTMTPEERLKGVPAEELRKRLSPEERLAGLSPEQIVASLPADELDRVVELRQQQRKKPKRKKKR